MTGLPRAIHHAVAGKLGIRHVIAIFGAHADGENVNAGAARPRAIIVIEVAVVFLAVAEDDQRVVVLAGFLERVDGETHRRGQVRSADRRPGFVDLLDGLADRPVIDGQRRIDIGAAGETDQPDAFVGHGVEQLVDDHFRLGEAVGFDVAHPHAARQVERDEHVAAERFFGPDAGIALRPGEAR